MATGDQIIPIGIAERMLPTPRTPDGGQSAIRIGGYGEQYVQNVLSNKQVCADEGSYFVATNPTPATAIALAVNASYDVTKNMFVFTNFDAPGGKRMYLDTLKIICTTAPASATSAHFSAVIDNVNRYTSGGTLIGPNGTYLPKCVNGDCAGTAVGGLYYATTTVITSPAASTTSRLVGRGVLRSVIPAVHDEMILNFGAMDNGGSSSTTAGRTVTNTSPVILGGGQSLVLTVWFPSNSATGLSFEFEAGWIER